MEAISDVRTCTIESRIHGAGSDGRLPEDSADEAATRLIVEQRGGIDTGSDPPGMTDARRRATRRTVERTGLDLDRRKKFLSSSAVRSAIESRLFPHRPLKEVPSPWTRLPPKN